MPITQEQRIARRRYIGSSDAAAICGIDPWQTAADIYHAKVSELDDAQSDAMDAGNRLESVVLDWAEEKLGSIRRNVAVVRSPIYAANHDAIVVGKPEGVEAKTAAIVGPGNLDEWGDEGTDQVPEHVIVQAHHQMFVSELAIVWVPVLIGGRGFRMYRVERNEQIVEAIRKREIDFWERCVLPCVPPPDSQPSLEVVRRIRRVPNKVVEIPESVVINWLDAKDALKRAETDEENARAVLLASLGDADAGDCSRGRLTYFEQQARRIDADALRFNFPDVADQVTRVTTSRVLRHKKPKGA